MADSFLTLSDLTTINDARLADRDISDLLIDAPFLATVAADTSPDTTHRYVKETGAPTVGFRAVNDGRENAKSTDTLVTVDLKILDASFSVDKALADAYRLGPDAYVAREAIRHLRSAFFELEKQMFDGTGNDSGGFSGLKDSANLNAIADTMVIDGGGTAAGGCSSVWAVRTSSDLNDVVAIAGNSGEIQIDEMTVQRQAGSATGSYPAYYTPITAWYGMQIGGAYSVGRLANVDSGSTFDDDSLADLIELFPSGRRPNYFVMSMRSLAKLRKSRTATNVSGAPAPFPADAFGIPIIVSDAIVDTDNQLT